MKLYPSNDKFVLMTGDEVNYKVLITDAVFKACHVKVSDVVMLAHNETLNQGPVMYPFWKSVIKSFAVPKGVSTFSSDDIFHGEVPSKLILGFVESTAFTGDYKLNPFNFQHFNVNSLQLSVDGQSVPQTHLSPNFATGDYVSSYLTLFFNKYPTHGGNFISREDYANGYSLFVFDISGEADRDFMSKQKKGHTRLQLTFGEVTPAPLMVIAYSLFPGLVTVDKARNIRLE